MGAEGGRDGAGAEVGGANPKQIRREKRENEQRRIYIPHTLTERRYNFPL